MRQDPRMLKPFIRLERSCSAGLNTSKLSVNARRINKEMMRQRMQKAKFIPASRLIKSDGTVKYAPLSN